MGFNLLQGLDVANMDEKTIEILRLMGKTIETAMNNYLADKLSKKEFEEKLAEQIKAIDSKAELASVKEQLKSAQDALIRMKGAMEKGDDGTLRLKSIEEQVAEQLKDYITVEKGVKKVDLKAACQSAAGFKKSITLVVKDNPTTITSGSLAPSLTTTVDEQLSVEPRANSVLRKFANVSSIGTRALTYAEYVDGNGDAAWVPEGGAKPMMDGSLREVTINAAKVALGAKLTEETMTDLPQLVAEIRAEIINKIGLKEEDGILNGTGTGGQIKGLVTAGSLPAFSMTTIKIASPTIIDAIVAAYTQIVNNSEQNYVPNVVLINPIDWANMAREKDSTGRPLNERLSDILLTGLNLVTSTGIAQGRLLLGDFAYLNIRDYVALTITFGWENDDFTKNLVTMIGEKRMMVYIKNQYKSAFVYDTIANIKTAITPAS